MNVSEYLRTIEANLRTGNATEHTHRSALAAFIQGLEPGITATNEPRSSSFGAIDYVVSRGGDGVSLPIGYIEAKDVSRNLAREEKSERMGQYRRSLANPILTGYLRFRWYRDGKLEQTARLANADPRGRITRDKDGGKVVLELSAGFLGQAPPRLGTPRELAERMAELTHLLREDTL